MEVPVGFAFLCLNLLVMVVHLRLSQYHGITETSHTAPVEFTPQTSVDRVAPRATVTAVDPLGSSSAVFSEYSLSNKPMAPMLNKRVLNTVNFQAGCNCSIHHMMIFLGRDIQLLGTKRKDNRLNSLANQLLSFVQLMGTPTSAPVFTA